MNSNSDQFLPTSDLRLARELVFELTLLGASGADLDLLLRRLFALLLRYPDLQIRPAGAILLFGPSGHLIQVAPHGDESADEAMDNSWQFMTRQPSARESAAFVLTTPDGQPVLALPVRRDDAPLGLVVVRLAASFVLDASQIAFLSDLGGALSGVITRNLIEETLRVRELELEEAHAAAIRRLGIASEYRDNETGWHIMRMTSIAVTIARTLGLDEKQRELLNITAPMHDVGKIGISDAILLKPGKLTAEEFAVMKQHTEIGEGLLLGDDLLLRTARDIAVAHHERWDGAGYPRGLQGESIPLFARICAVADVFDALTSVRPYKPAWDVDVAIEFIIGESGRQFDPHVVDAFIESIPEVLRIRQLYRDDIIDPRETLSLPKIPHRDDAWVVWDDDLNTGIEVIDQHHRFLFDLVNDLHETVVLKRGAREVARALAALDIYAKVHFRAEEQMMAHQGYGGLDKQQGQHEAFENTLRAFHEQLRVNPLTTQFEVLHYLRKWLIGHIKHEDAQLVALLH